MRCDIGNPHEIYLSGLFNHAGFALNSDSMFPVRILYASQRMLRIHSCFQDRSKIVLSFYWDSCYGTLGSWDSLSRVRIYQYVFARLRLNSSAPICTGKDSSIRNYRTYGNVYILYGAPALGAVPTTTEATVLLQNWLSYNYSGPGSGPTQVRKTKTSYLRSQ